MSQFDQEYGLILNHTVKIARRTGYTSTGMGQRRPTGETTVTDGASVFMQSMNGRKINTPTGDVKHADYLMYVRYNQDVQEGDLIYPQTVVVGLTMGRVVYVEPIMDFDGHTHHTEAYVERSA